MSSSNVTRPASVTVVVVLTWITAVIEIIGGILLLVLAPAVRSSGGPANVALLLGGLVLLIGLITAAVASRLARGGNGARILVTVLTVLQIVSVLTAILAVDVSGSASPGIGTLVIDVVLLALLWNRRANEFFAAR